MIVGRLVASLALIALGWFSTTLILWLVARRAEKAPSAPWMWRSATRLFLVSLATVLALHWFNPIGPLLVGFMPSVASNASSYQSGIKLGTKNVAVGGGGYVIGVYLHPRQKDLVYIRTDVGGFYRWNAKAQTWIPLLEHLTLEQKNQFGGEALALDPNDPNVVYVAVGKSHWFGPGTLLKSTNQGETWTPLKLELPIAEDYRRWGGERLAVNPSNSKDVLFGAWKDGLWKSTNAGAAWTRISALPTEAKEPNVNAIVFDPRERGLVYAHVDGDGVFRSTDAGTTWTRLDGSPKHVMRMAIAGDRALYTVSYEGPAVAKFANGTWKDITPPGEDPVFGALSVNPKNPSEILVSRGENSNPDMYRSTDGGASWKKLSRRTTSTVPWWSEYMRNLAWVSAIEFDPHVPGRVWLTDWYGIWRTDQVTADPVRWTNYEQGHEEIVILTLVSPPKGPLLLSGAADVDGFVHDNGLDAFPSKSFGARGPGFQDTYSIDYSRTNPQRMVRVSGDRRDDGRQGGATSRDGGSSWQEFKSFPSGIVPTRVVMSATNPDLFVVTTSKGQPVRSTDGGKTWSSVSGLPDGAKGPWNMPPQPLAADTVDGNTFYYYSNNGTVYRSTDGGATFSVMTDKLSWIEWSTIQALPGAKGDVWLGLDEEGLRRSTDGGKTFTAIPAVEQAYLFDFGLPQPGSRTPALYVYGKIKGQGAGIFRSLDLGKTWTRINAPNRPIGNEPRVLEASWQTFGLVFVGSNGRGIYYGSS